MRAPLGNLFQEDEAEEINMTPMLDVVFIMLIFFIVTASFVKEAGIDVNRPQGSVVIQADKKATTEMLIKVMDASRAAGAFDVSIAAQDAS
ncbi:MAG: ExbD/TolR family protein [Pseudoalteromonas sp.]